MSRARQIGGIWFDGNRKGEKATAQQLELLAAAENVQLDDLLDEGLRQHEVAFRLRAALGEGVIPPEILERRRQAREEAAKQPACRICTALDTTCEGSITRHHFVNRWIMMLLENYVSYAPRRMCTIPICVGRHRDLHFREDTETPKSIAQFMQPHERQFAQKMLDEFKAERPHVYDLLAGGDEASYEYQLIRDHQLGLFRTSRWEDEASSLPDSESEAVLVLG
jgi:hypothetical protein